MAFGARKSGIFRMQGETSAHTVPRQQRSAIAAPAAPVLGSQVRDAGNSNKVRGKPKG
tara:strand:+ start:1729 stop:1902 length:174 start_codon:yes stop_codon:yes gene_type:complete